MCERLILEGTKYICDSCWEELATYKKTWPRTLRKVDVRRFIDFFMSMPPGTYIPVEGDEVEAEFRRLTS
jgi:hypothetical protein